MIFQGFSRVAVQRPQKTGAELQKRVFPIFVRSVRKSLENCLLLCDSVAAALIAAAISMLDASALGVTPKYSLTYYGAFSIIKIPF